MKILFVCTGNVCRSAMAEYLFKKRILEFNRTDIEVKSCGIRAREEYRIPSIVVSLMESEGIDITNHQPTLMSEDLLNWADVVLVMDYEHLDFIKEYYPDFFGKTYLFKTYAHPGINFRPEQAEIFDPIGQSDEVYVGCTREIKSSVYSLADRISSL